MLNTRASFQTVTMHAAAGGNLTQGLLRLSTAKHRPNKVIELPWCHWKHGNDLESLPHGGAGVLAVHAGEWARVLVQAAVVVHDVDDLQAAPPPDLR